MLPKKPTIVHLNKSRCDLVIDRRTKWGNPFTLDHVITEEDANVLGDPSRIGETVTRDECIDLFKNYLKHNEELLASLSELDNLVLGCWCKPKRCHGDAIVEIWLEERNKNLFEY